MITKELIKFIRDERADDVPDSEIIKTLKKEGGWNDTDIQEAFEKLDSANVVRKKSETKKQSQSKAHTKHNTSVKNKPSREQSKRLNQSDGISHRSDSTVTGSTNNETNTGMTRKIIVISIAIFVFGSVVIGAVYGYMTYVATDYDALLSSAIVNTKDNLQSLDAITQSVGITVDGKYGQMTETVSPTISYTSTMGINNDDPAIKFELEMADIPVSLSGQPQVTVNGDLVYKNDTIYGKINGISQSTPFIPANIINEINNVWIRFDNESMRNLQGTSSTSTLFATDYFDEINSKIQKNITTMQEQLQKPFALYQKYPYFTVMEYHGDVELNGVNAYYFELDIDEEQFINFVEAYVNELAIEDQLIKQYVENSNTPDIRVWIQNVLISSVADHQIEVWISKKDETILQQSARITVDPKTLISQINTEIVSTLPGVQKISIPEKLILNDIVLSFEFNLDEGVAIISAPEQSTGIDDITNHVTEIWEKSESKNVFLESFIEGFVQGVEENGSVPIKDLKEEEVSE